MELDTWSFGDTLFLVMCTLFNGKYLTTLDWTLISCYILLLKKFRSE